MNHKDFMTKRQAEEKMECLREVFDVVRLVDGKMLKERSECLENIEPCQCYSVWHKQEPCENCISIHALEGKTQASKLEFMDSDIFQVFARYVEIDGKPYVMEMLRKLEEDTLIDTLGYEKIVERLAIYNEKLYKDALTGAYNRRYYEDEMKKVEGAAGIAILDLDDFKLYNDTHGHSAGDRALITVVKVIKQYIQKTDKLIRYGGDEFLLVIPDIDKDSFSKKLNKIQSKIAGTKVPGYNRMQLSVSIGGVMAGEETVEEAVVRADRLMYLAKTQKNMAVTEGEEAKVTEEHDGKEEDKIRQQILIVDDSELNREILEEMLHNEYRILEAENGEECVAMLEQYGTGISLILLDIVMPKMDGFEVLAYMNREKWIEDIPVIMISSEDSENFIRKAYELGVSDYISRPFDAKIVYRRVFNMIKLYAKQRRLIRLVTDQIYEKEKNNQMMVSTLSQVVEFRNGESGLHMLHINKLTGLLIERLVEKTDRYSLTWEDQYVIATASALHDIGKIGIDEKILNKPGRLTKEEFEIMKTHAQIGADMLKSLELYKDEELVKYAYEICRWHHERYDGRGYPDGLKGDEIPISAQVVSIVDVYDALVSKRVYKDAYTHEEAIQMILNGECGTFNPILLECLMEIEGKIKQEMQQKSSKEYIQDTKMKHPDIKDTHFSDVAMLEKSK